jgi:hypothetical protein
MWPQSTWITKFTRTLPKLANTRLSVRKETRENRPIWEPGLSPRTLHHLGKHLASFHLQQTGSRTDAWELKTRGLTIVTTMSMENPAMDTFLKTAIFSGMNVAILV